MFLFRETVDIVYLKYFFSFLERENWSRNIPRAKKKWGREFLGRGMSHPELSAFNCEVFLPIIVATVAAAVPGCRAALRRQLLVLGQQRVELLLTNQRLLLRSRDQLSSNHSSPGRVGTRAS